MAPMSPNPHPGLENSFNQVVEVINDPLRLCAQGGLCVLSVRAGGVTPADPSREGKPRTAFSTLRVRTRMQLKRCQTHPNANRDEYSNWWKALKAYLQLCWPRAPLLTPKSKGGWRGGVRSVGSGV